MKQFQEQAVTNVMKGNDPLVVVPTGAGWFLAETVVVKASGQLHD